MKKITFTLSGLVIGTLIALFLLSFVETVQLLTWYFAALVAVSLTLLVKNFWKWA